MALGNNTQQGNKIWLSIYNGKVERSENGQKTQYSYVEGRLVGIYTQERTYKGERVTKWFIDLQGEQGEAYSIGFPYSSGSLKSIVLALASDEALTSQNRVRIEPYLKGEFTNIVVRSNGAKLDWVVRELPAVENVEVGGKTYKDDSKRMELIASYVEQINQRLRR